MYYIICQTQDDYYPGLMQCHRFETLAGAQEAKDELLKEYKGQSFEVFIICGEML